VLLSDVGRGRDSAVIQVEQTCVVWRGCEGRLHASVLLRREQKAREVGKRLTR
jgi:hypothetical protein